MKDFLSSCEVQMYFESSVSFIIFCSSVKVLSTKKKSSCFAYASKSVLTANLRTFSMFRTEFCAVSASFGILRRVRVDAGDWNGRLFAPFP